MKHLKPVIVDGEIVMNYFVCPEGDIWSTKRGSLTRLSPTVSGNTLYPKVSLQLKGKSKTLYSHRIVCETFHPFPIPEGVTKAEWKATPESVKSLLANLYQVNHIDHDHKNFHPSNLEWVTTKQNNAKYQEHRKENDGQRKTGKPNKSTSVVEAFTGLETFFLEERTTSSKA